ncbi:MAG: nucleoside monophosphate kinase [Alphaproteobacteria bacterium]
MQNTDPVIIIFIGPPASGKGTAAQFFKNMGFDVVSIGEMLRDAVAQGTENGKKAAPLMHAGHLVPENIVTDMLRDRMSSTAATGYLFDGSPRTAEQAKNMDDLFREKGIAAENIYVLRLDVDDDNLRARVKKRHDTAVASGVKPRTDDDPAVFEVRLAGYKKDIIDISAHYGPRLRIIDGNISAQETVRQVQALIGTPLPPANKKPQTPVQTPTP